MNDVIPCTLIRLDNNELISNITYDGQNYISSSYNSNMIIKYDLSFKEVIKVYTEHSFPFLTYDPIDNNFWAITKEDTLVFYKLSSAMNIEHTIPFNQLSRFGEVVSLLFNDQTNRLVVIFKKHIIEFDKNTFHYSTIYSRRNGIISCGTFLSHYLMFCVLNNNSYHLLTLNEHKKIIQSVPLDVDFIIQDLIINYLHISADTSSFYFLVNKEDMNQLYQWEISNTFVGPYSPPSFNTLSKWNMETSKNGSYTITDVNVNSCNRKQTTCNSCSCNLWENRCSTTSPCTTPPCVPSSCTTCADACSQLIESIALVEASIARILNSEGEKLQKVLAESNDLEFILCVNREINKTIINVTHLEQSLYSKLSAILDSNLCGKKDCNLSS